MRPDGAEIWDGPYVRGAQNLIDPWGGTITYRPPRDDGMYRLITFGADGAEGGEGDNLDLVAPQLGELES